MPIVVNHSPIASIMALARQAGQNDYARWKFGAERDLNAEKMRQRAFEYGVQQDSITNAWRQSEAARNQKNIEDERLERSKREAADLDARNQREARDQANKDRDYSLEQKRYELARKAQEDAEKLRREALNMKAEEQKAEAEAAARAGFEGSPEYKSILARRKEVESGIESSYKQLDMLNSMMKRYEAAYDKERLAQAQQQADAVIQDINRRRQGLLEIDSDLERARRSFGQASGSGGQQQPAQPGAASPAADPVQVTAKQIAKQIPLAEIPKEVDSPLEIAEYVKKRMDGIGYKVDPKVLMAAAEHIQFELELNAAREQEERQKAQAAADQSPGLLGLDGEQRRLIAYQLAQNASVVGTLKDAADAWSITAAYGLDIFRSGPAKATEAYKRKMAEHVRGKATAKAVPGMRWFQEGLEEQLR